MAAWPSMPSLWIGRNRSSAGRQIDGTGLVLVLAVSGKVHRQGRLGYGAVPHSNAQMALGIQVDEFQQERHVSSSAASDARRHL